MRRLLLFTLFFLFLLLPSRSQDHHPRFESIDVLNYRFEIDLNDSTNLIRGIADMDIVFKKGLDQFQIDLASFQADGTGMKVERITADGKDLQFLHQENQITLSIPHTREGSKHRFRIIYSGIPGDGLIISKNKFGDRTFWR